jgi:hypothetical protein
MNLAEFRRALSRRAAPGGLSPELTALWWSAKGDWNKAHDIVMDASGREAAWIHAYLHRLEGDLDNARYWYAQAGRAPATGPLEAEWDDIVASLLQASSGNIIPRTKS